MIIQGRINFKQVDVLLDTGSSVNIIPKNIISQIKGYHNVEYIKTKIATINGEIEVRIIPNSDYDIINMIIDKYKHVFAKNKFDVGELKCNSPKIILTSELPIVNRPYRTSFKDDTEIKKQLDALLKAGIIKPSYSSYAAPITLAFKKEDSARTRLCIDYRKLNAITKLDAEPIPE
ncbi:retrovirus-related Pol polyprotein from transposon 412 [Trichonephila clavipes]|nr:retrovirus-related Pol polyprotein from transposon 412 [Trichonephila clavipes]